MAPKRHKGLKGQKGLEGLKIAEIRAFSSIEIVNRGYWLPANA
jgi:hypothetical protein